jgi:hypothetical protein
MWFLVGPVGIGSAGLFYLSIRLLMCSNCVIASRSTDKMKKPAVKKVPMKKTASEVLHVRVPELELGMLKRANADVPEIVRQAIREAARLV